MTDSYSDHGEVAAAGSPAHDAMSRVSISKVIDNLQGEFPDISVSKIRFLESRGLVSPDRAASGFRRFSDDDIGRLRWILTMQRDHFLPLRVIKERLDSGDLGAALGEDDEADQTIASIPKAPSSRFRAPAPARDHVDASDMSRLTGLTAAQLDELVKYGIVDVSDTDNGPRFGREELRVGKAAAAFLERGIGARHLKAWRLAAEREAAMLEQVLRPLVSHNASDAAARGRDVADELIDTGNVIREVVIVKMLRDSLGLTEE